MNLIAEQRQSRGDIADGRPSPKPVVEFENVVKIYPGSDVKVLDGVSFTINEGEFLILVGPSGCGKSTCLRLLAGLEDITEGTIKIDGVVVNDLPPKDRNISMVFQSYALFPHMTVYDNIAFGLKVRKERKEVIDEKVRDIAEMLDLTDHLNKKPGQLSGGQRQRVALGRALIRKAKVFLLDEPLSNLDAKLRARMRTEIKRIQRKFNVATLYVTHDQIEGMTMGDRIAILNAGQIQQIGTPSEIYNNPANKFVAGFVGTPTMNFFTMKVKISGDKTAPDEKNAHTVWLESPDFILKLDNADGYSVDFGKLGSVILGIRPEHVKIKPLGDGSSSDGGETADGGRGFRAEVDLIELIGPYHIIHLIAGNSEIIAQTYAADLQMGQKVLVEFPSDKRYLFDALTELALPKKGARRAESGRPESPDENGEKSEGSD